MSKSQFFGMWIEPELYAQLKRRADRDHDGIVSRTGYDALRAFLGLPTFKRTQDDTPPTSGGAH